MLEAAVISELQSHALEAYPAECCGIVINERGVQKYIKCTNTALKPLETFKISAEERTTIEDLGDVIAICHSHPDWVSDPSPADIAACEASEVTWAIVSVNEGVVSEPRYVSPKGILFPLVGREFFHGVLDCYSLVKDYYLREHGIELLDFEREDKWWDNGQNLYIDNFKKTGFRELHVDEQIAESDVILMAIRSKVANHAGIYIDKKELKEAPRLFKVPNAMLHHLYGRLSERAVYGGYWADQTVTILRHVCLDK